jgi:ABC-type sugar transport system ATPase subunit
MPAITLRGINNYACHDTNLDIKDGELLFILGPNGSGKTTLLNVIAGLVDYQGTVMFDGNSIDRIPANKREVGYLFQNLLLFPHMNVRTNIGYSLRMQKWTQDMIDDRVDELLNHMNITHLAMRYPGNLSGGEKQRVAMARALALSPKVLLMDEPMSSLDSQTAAHLRIELKQLQRQLGITSVYVTHDLNEAINMADRIAILNSGEISQVGTAEEIFFHPCNAAVMNYLGRPNILDCDQCRSVGRGIMEADCRGLKIIVPHDGKSFTRIIIYPRDVFVSTSEPLGSRVNRFKGIITDIKTSESTVRLRFKVGENMLRAELTRQAFEEMGLSNGMEVFVTLSLRRINIFESGETDLFPGTSYQNSER